MAVVRTMIGVVVFLLVGLLSIETLWLAFFPAALYLAIDIIEGETVTPMLAITTIICDRIGPLTAFGHFMEG